MVRVLATGQVEVATFGNAEFWVSHFFCSYIYFLRYSLDLQDRG
jgi:hypothetical protein